MTVVLIAEIAVQQDKCHAPKKALHFAVSGVMPV
jgi:hypothetical protein